MTLRLLLVVLAVIVPTPAFSDAVIADWVGEYTMNHDGFRGTLQIIDTKIACPTPAWCNMRLSYMDQKGSRRSGSIERITDQNQHMTFVINFPGNNQRFDAYLMSWDKTTMAGTTFWGGRTFGFYAAKRRPELPSPIPSGGAVSAERGRSITKDGTLEVSYVDGSRKRRRPGECGYTIIPPSGPPRAVMCQQVPPAMPPNPPDAVTSTWLDAHNDALLGILRLYLDDSSISNYQANSEAGGVSIYKKIYTRTDLLHDLSEAR